MTTHDYLAHARDVLGFDAQKIQKNYYAIAKGMFYTMNTALEKNSTRANKALDKSARSDAEVADKKAKHGKAYTTQACVDWRKSLDYRILSREHMNKRGQRVDIYSGWDVLSLSPDGVHHLDQAFPPGGWPSHEKKMLGNRSIERGREIKAVMHGVAFERGNKEPVEMHEIK